MQACIHHTALAPADWSVAFCDTFTTNENEWFTGEFDGDMNTLRMLSYLVRDRLSSGVILLGSRREGKALLVLSVTKDLASRFHAGKLIREVAKKVGGKGGGRPDMGQAGGPSQERLEEAFQKVKELLEKET